MVREFAHYIAGDRALIHLHTHIVVVCPLHLVVQDVASYVY